MTEADERIGTIHTFNPDKKVQVYIGRQAVSLDHVEYKILDIVNPFDGTHVPDRWIDQHIHVRIELTDSGRNQLADNLVWRCHWDDERAADYVDELANAWTMVRDDMEFIFTFNEGWRRDPYEHVAFMAVIDIGDDCTHCGTTTEWNSERIPSLTETKNGWMCNECQKLECDKCGQRVLDYELYNNNVYCSDCMYTAEHIFKED